MLKTRIILVVASAVVIWLIFLLPKAVVENESQLKSTDSTSSHKGASPAKGHSEIPRPYNNRINQGCERWLRLSTSSE